MPWPKQPKGVFVLGSKFKVTAHQPKKLNVVGLETACHIHCIWIQDEESMYAGAQLVSDFEVQGPTPENSVGDFKGSFITLVNSKIIYVYSEAKLISVIPQRSFQRLF